MLDKLLVLLSMIGLTVFCGVMLVYVAEPDLIVVTALVLALAFHDFWISVFRKQEPSAADTGAELEERPTAVSGKPLDTARELASDVELSEGDKEETGAEKKPAKKKSAAKASAKEGSAKK